MATLATPEGEDAVDAGSESAAQDKSAESSEQPPGIESSEGETKGGAADEPAAETSADAAAPEPAKQ